MCANTLESRLCACGSQLLACMKTKPLTDTFDMKWDIKLFHTFVTVRIKPFHSFPHSQSLAWENRKWWCKNDYSNNKKSIFHVEASNNSHPFRSVMPGNELPAKLQHTETLHFPSTSCSIRGRGQRWEGKKIHTLSWSKRRRLCGSKEAMLRR